MSEFNLEKRYIVLKISDVEHFLTDEEQSVLARIEQKLSVSRSSSGKGELSGLFIEKDWPEFNPILSMLKLRVDNELFKKNITDLVQGLNWYREEHPQDWSTEDDEVLSNARNAISK